MIVIATIYNPKNDEVIREHKLNWPSSQAQTFLRRFSSWALNNGFAVELINKKDEPNNG